jgi:cytochrome c
VWDETTLDAYVADPERIVPGTRMSAMPLRDAQDRADLIAYLARTGRALP